MAVLKIKRNGSEYEVRTGNTPNLILYEDLDYETKIHVETVLMHLKQELGTHECEEIAQNMELPCTCNDFLGPTRLICLSKFTRGAYQGYIAKIYLCPHCKGKGYFDWIERLRVDGNAVRPKRKLKIFQYFSVYVSFWFDDNGDMKIYHSSFALPNTSGIPQENMKICKKIS
jgi:hypothetical protein